jgi:hypothetical protein
MTMAIVFRKARRSASRWRLILAGLLVVAGLLVSACSASPSAPQVTSPSSPSGDNNSSTTTGGSAPTSVSISSVMGGNAHPSLQPGTAGDLSVIFQGAPYNPGADPSDGTVVPVVVWNGTNSVVNNVDVSGPATSGGSVVSSGDSQNIEPANLSPGEAAFGMVFFQQAVPSGASFSFTASASKGQSTYFLDAQVTQANYSSGGGNGLGDAVVGSVTNQTGLAMNGPISADVYCFGASGQFDYVASGFLSGNGPLASGASGSYSTNDITAGTCSTYLVGSSGFGQE